MAQILLPTRVFHTAYQAWLNSLRAARAEKWRLLALAHLDAGAGRANSWDGRPLGPVTRIDGDKVTVSLRPLVTVDIQHVRRVQS